MNTDDRIRQRAREDLQEILEWEEGAWPEGFLPAAPARQLLEAIIAGKDVEPILDAAPAWIGLRQWYARWLCGGGSRFRARTLA